MLKILKKLFDKISNEEWLKMVEAANEKGKLTADEYVELTAMVTES